MTQQEIQDMQAKIGVKPDGFWGPKSIAACQAYLSKLMPSPIFWPETNQAALTQFYGPAGDESKLTTINVAPLGMLYEGKPVRIIRCHAKVSDSLKRILTAISQSPHRKVLEKYAGVFNNRAMRGGTLPSLHARAAAIDLDPDSNANHSPWPTRSTMPLEVMEIFAKEGWLSAGAFWGRDAMHFQATT